MVEGEGHFPFTSLTSKECMLEIHGIRGISDDVDVAARTSWDGNPDACFNFRNRNYAANGAYGAIRGGMVQVQNRAGGELVWMRGLDVEADNRGTLTDAIKALRIGVRNNATVATDVVGLEIEMLSQGICSGDDVAIDLIHNDASSVASEPIGINFRASRVTNGFQFCLRTEQYGVDLKGQDSADSAIFKFYDDGENVDLDNTGVLADISATANAGYLKVVVGTTVRYIALYAKKAS